MSNEHPTKNMCPVCGYDDLYKPAYRPENDYKKGTPSFEICPSCYYQFGLTDDDKNITHAQWRQQWIAKGMPWNGKGIKAPLNWNPREQLLNIGVKV